MIIDCETCVMREIACGDCVVSALLDAGGARLELDGAERDALGALAQGGLLPPLRLVPRLGDVIVADRRTARTQADGLAG